MLCKKYHATEILRQIPDVGEATALTFVLIAGAPTDSKIPEDSVLTMAWFRNRIHQEIRINCLT